MKIYNNPAKKDWSNILKRPVIEKKNLEGLVQSIISQVKKEGDQALFEFGKKFDKVSLSSLTASAAEIEKAVQSVDPELKAAINVARTNIERFHRAQKQEMEVIETMPGVQCWRKSVAIPKVGLYIPGGTAPLFSTVLMLGVPAQIAACEEVTLCTPPRKDGTINPVILYTAQLVGITKIYKVGGAQAIAAMAFGTETIPAVDKIFGPGNQFVTEAKQQANQTGLAIDLPAGPSEVMVVADQSANPEFVAADLLSQAEHGADSQVVLLAFEENFVNQVLLAIEEQLIVLPRKSIAKKALENSVAVIVNQRETALEITNFYAPEHLILSIENAELFTANLQNAGSVFLGNYTPESAGDYASGTNHTLPTNGYARAYSGVSLDSFVKKITFQKITSKGLMNLGASVEQMAKAEQLEAHKNAVSIRLQAIRAEQKEKGNKDDRLIEKSKPSLSIKALVRSDLRAFKPYASARDEFTGEAEVFLDANENPFANELNRYPDPLQRVLKAKIAELKKVKSENIFLGNGSDEAIDLLIRLFCEPGTDTILTLPPTYGVYNVCAKTAGVQVNTLPLDENFQPDLNGLKSLGARSAKLLFICNPNNPSGSTIPIAVLEEMISGFPGIVVVDEAYIDFSNTQSCTQLINQYRNLVILQTFSKAWGMAGIRLGMAFSNPEIIKWLNKIKLPYNINQLTQNEVLNKFENEAIVQQQIQIIKAERTKVAEALSNFDFVKKVFPSETNFILVQVEKPKALYNFLLSKGIIVRDRSTQLNCTNCLRITIGTSKENSRLLKALGVFKNQKIISV